MSGMENRRNERYPLMRQPNGRVFIKTESSRCLVDYIRDISSSGISAAIGQALSSMANVTVEYVTASGNIEIYGKVAWCRSNASTAGRDHANDAYLLGIELLSPMTLFSLLQQHTIR
jgi:PilZ domain